MALIGVFAALGLAIRWCCRDGGGWSPFWPATGALVAALLVLPSRLSFAVLFIDFVINIIINIFFYPGIFGMIFDSLLNCGLALLLAILMRNFCGAAADLSRFRRLATFICLSIIAAGIEAAIGEFIYAIEKQPNVDFGGWFWWTSCDALGAIIATPTILLFIKHNRYIKKNQASRSERFALFLIIFCFVLFAFSQSHSDIYIFAYPLLLLMAFRAGPAWVMASVLTVSIVASAMTIHGYGPLAGMSFGNARLMQNLVQQFLLSLFVCAVPANNALGEIARSAQRLRRIHAGAQEARRTAVAANLAKSQFIANVSHEIRTPLNGVLGMAQALAVTDLSVLQRERVDIIHSSGQVLLGILNDVLDFSKIEAGKLDLEAAYFDLAKIVQEVQAAFSAVADGKGLKLSLRLEGPQGDLHVGDPTRVRQIISNLVSNALKFTEVGEVQIALSRLDNGITLSIRDTGIGIPADKLPKLFGQFEQVDASTTRRFGGTGLGLSICHELCRLMGGRIVVESVLGSGSTFTVHLPLKTLSALDERPARALAAELDSADPTTYDLRVLAAEDNKINQLVLTTLLQQMGIAPTIVEDGACALEAWRTSEFDLILMDMQMPVMDGLTAVRAIRGAEALSSRARSPIIALTADVMSHQIAEYHRAGVDAVVAKPLQFSQLAEAIQALLEPEGGTDAPDLMRA